MYHANTNNYLHHRAGVYPPALNCVLTIYVFQKLLPRIFVGNKVEGALLSSYVVVANDVTAVQIANVTQPSGQFYEGLIGCICKLAGFVRVADFN